MITSLNIKNVTTCDPENGVQINDLKKVNFIYGANGSGKTTISNFFQLGHYNQMMGIETENNKTA